MAEFGVFIGWGQPRVGREAAAAKLADEAFAWATAQQAAGEIETFERVLLSSHGGDLNGFFLVRGDPEKLARSRMSPEFQRLVYRAGVCFENFGVVDAVVDAGVTRLMGAWGEAIADLI